MIDNHDITQVVGYTIGVFGSAVGEGERVGKLAKELAHELSRFPVTLCTGACSGVPYVAAKEALRLGLPVWGISPEVSAEAQEKEYPNDDIRVYKKLVFVPLNYRSFLEIDPGRFRSSERMARKKLRNVTSTANCDAGIIISGRWGTLNEFTNLHDMDKVIGVLTGTGGIADELPALVRKIHKKSSAVVFFNKNPRMLIHEIMAELDRRKQS